MIVQLIVAFVLGRRTEEEIKKGNLNKKRFSQNY